MNAQILKSKKMNIGYRTLEHVAHSHAYHVIDHLSDGRVIKTTVYTSYRRALAQL